VLSRDGGGLRGFAFNIVRPSKLDNSDRWTLFIPRDGQRTDGRQTDGQRLPANANLALDGASNYIYKVKVVSVFIRA